MFICSCVLHSPWREFRHLEFADSVLLSVSLLITILFASILRQCVKLLQIEIHHGIYLHSLLWYSCNHSDALRLLQPPPATPSILPSCGPVPGVWRTRARARAATEFCENFTIFFVKMFCFDANAIWAQRFLRHLSMVILQLQEDSMYLNACLA